MFKRIFVPTDGSPEGRATARIAARLARLHGGRVRACYVVSEAQTHGPTTLSYLRDRVESELEQEGHRALRAVRRICDTLRVPYSEVRPAGRVGPEIAREARRFRADVIVMATEGLGRARAFLLGSLAHEVLSRASCPVLIVRRPVARRAARVRRG